MARRRGMIRYGSFAEVTHGIVGPKAWLVYRFRRWAWGIIAVAVFAMAITTLLALGQNWLVDVTSPSISIASTRALLALAQLTLLGFIATLLWGMNTGSMEIMPTFSAPVPRFEPRPPPDLEAGETWEDWLRKGVRIGRWQSAPGDPELGPIAWLRIIDSHPFIAAETRMGKSNLLWAILWELKPAIDAGVVEIILFDPKNGMEMAPAVKLGLVKSRERLGRKEGHVDEIDNFYYGQDVGAPDPTNPEKWIGKRYGDTFVAPIEHHVQQMRVRAGEVRGNMQSIPASTTYKRRIVIVDEGASLARPGTTLDTRKRIIAGMMDLCDQGAGAGYTVITCTQHPDLKKVPWRHGLVGDHLCGLVKTWDAVDMVLGNGSYAKGAWADQLNPRIPGVFFMARHGAWQLRVQDAKPKFVKKPPGGGGKEIEKFDTDTEPTNEELASVHQLRPRTQEAARWAEYAGEEEETGRAVGW